MFGQAHERESALMQAASSTHAAITPPSLWAGDMQADTAAILGTLATIAGGVTIGATPTRSFPVVASASFGLIAHGVFGLRNLPLHGFGQSGIWCQLAALASELI